MKQTPISVEYIDHMGSDLRVVNAARVSMNKLSTEFDSSDEKLIKYLATHNHWTPFAHCTVTLLVKVPIFVARQEFKHQVGLTRNEVSRRYVTDEPEFFKPLSWRSAPTESIKQGSGDDLSERTSKLLDLIVDSEHREAIKAYNLKLGLGLCAEQARASLPQSMMTEYYVTGSLAAFARIIKQRTDSHAQVEIQDMAHLMQDIIKPLFPVSLTALT